MAKPELRHNPKFKRLCKKLRLPPPYVCGLLEFMWHAGQESFNALLGDPDDVELAAEWPGPRGKLFKILRDERWIDEKCGRFYIHDLYEHSTDYVRRKLRERQDKDLQQKNAEKVCESSDNAQGGVQTPPLPPLPPLPPIQPTTMGSAEAEAVDSKIHAYFREHPKLNWDAHTHAKMLKLVDIAGWDGATKLVNEAISKGKGMPVGWALTVAASKQAEQDIKSAQPTAAQRAMARVAAVK